LNKSSFDKYKSSSTIAVFLLIICIIWLSANSFIFETVREKVVAFSISVILIAVCIFLVSKQVSSRAKQLHHLISDTLFQSTGVAVTYINLSGTIVEMNQTAYKMLGYDNADELIGSSVIDLAESGSVEDFKSAMSKLNSGEAVTATLTVMHRSSFPLSFEICFEPVTSKGKLVGAILVAHDLSDHKRNLERIKYMAYYDDLTGIPNRALFHIRLDEELIRANEEQSLLGVVYIDLDNFKLVNATFGREYADLALLSIAERLNRFTSSSDFVARMEGDEFAVILVGHQTIESIIEKVESLHKQLIEPYDLKGEQLHIEASMGVAINYDHEDDSYAMFKKADMALLKVKETEGEYRLIYSQEWIHSSYDRLNLQHEIHRAIKNKEFVLHYQPQYDLENGKMIGMEALIRWNHPTRGLLYPYYFIPIAEQSNLIVEIGEWVIREACMQNKEWLDAGYPIVPVSVNLSIRQFIKNEMAQQIKTILEETGLSAQYLDIEITESMSIDIVEINEKLTEISKLGVGISVDDFGTGYSSFHYLKSFPISRLKIDRSFVMDILKEKNNEEIVSAIIAMAHKLDLQVIAEGVETVEQLELLRSIQCDEIQGYLKSPPVPKEQFVSLFQTTSKK